MPRLPFAVVVLSLIGAACTAAGTPTTSGNVASPTSSPPGTAGHPIVLVAGTFQVPGAQAFGEPGFHESIVVEGAVPVDAAGLSGTLAVRLRDAARPDQTCGRDHPLSGCVTVDWSDFEDRPNVPPGGVFDNHLSTRSETGPIDLFLSENGDLALTPDSYSPT